MSKEKEARKQRGIFEKVPGSGVWWVWYADASRKIRREKVGPKGMAIKLYHKRKTEVLQRKKLPEHFRAKAVSFEQLAQHTLEYSRVHKRSYHDDVIRMKRLRQWFGDRPAESITPQDIERRLAELTHLKPATLNRYRALLSLAFRLGVQNGKVTSNPARLVKLRRENNGRLRWLTEEEETKLRKAVEAQCPHHLPELDLAIHTGLRLSEQYGLSWDCVNFDSRVLTIPRSKHGEHRYVFLNDAALAALESARRQSNGAKWVFLNRYGERLVGPREWFDPAVAAAGLAGFTWHCLRHTFASRLVMAGENLRAVQELMGHKTIQMTVRYAHLAPQHLLAAVQKLCNTGSAPQNGATRTSTRTSDSEKGSEGVAAVN